MEDRDAFQDTIQIYINEAEAERNKFRAATEAAQIRLEAYKTALAVYNKRKEAKA